MLLLDRKIQSLGPVWVWGLAFLYALVAGLTLQKLVLPLVPSLHAGYGLLHQDALHYHLVAVQLSERIQAIGWSEWKLFPAIGGGTGNVGLLSALYVWFGPNPVWFLPFAAAAHATAATVLYLLGPVLWPGRVGRVGGLVAAALFVMYPSSMLSYGQNYKDPFAVAGTLLVGYAFLRALTSSQVRSMRILATLTAGILLIWCVRPYLLLVVTGGLVSALVVVASRATLRRRLACEYVGLVGGIVCVVLILTAVIVLPKGRNQENFSDASVVTSLTGTPHQGWQWKPTGWVPASMDEALKRLSVLRVGFSAHGDSVGAGSQIDADQMPDSAVDAIEYMPRAAMVGLLSPFPSSWTEKMSLFRVVGAMETALWYLLIPGLLLAVALRPSSAMLAGLILCGIMIMFYSYIQPNVGSLYRVRGGPLFFFVLCGAIGWARVGLKLFAMARCMRRSEMSENETLCEPQGTSSITDVSAAGIAVVLLTAAWYFGFLVRDLMLVNIYGLGGQLDAFLSASMIPMFLVGALMLPLADAMTAPFIQAGGGRINEEAARFTRSLISLAAIVVSVAGIGLLVTADWIVPLFVSGGTPHDLDEAVTMLRWFTVLLVLSAWTVVGNGVLSATNRPLAASMAQLCVPVITIISIIALSDLLGLRAAIAGMIAGTFLNAAIAAYCSRRVGAPLRPHLPHRWVDLSSVYRNYSLLVLVALLVGLVTPINYAFAARLEPGAVTAWAFGGKFVQLLAGLATVASAAVLTPHFSRLLAFRRSSQLASDVYFIVTACTWLSIMMALVLFAFFEPLVLAIFQGPEVSDVQAQYLAGILRVGSLQIPFVVAMTLIIKFAAVSRQSSRAVVAVGVGVAVNLMLNMFLVPVYGLYGIAVATVAGSACSAIYLSFAMRCHCGFDWWQVLLMNASWLAMFGVAVSVTYQSRVAVAGAFVSILLVLAAQWHAWQRRCRALPHQKFPDSSAAKLAA